MAPALAASEILPPPPLLPSKSMEVEPSSTRSCAGGGDGRQESAAAAALATGGGHEQQQQQHDGKIPHGNNDTTCASSSSSASVEALLSVPLSLIMRELPTPAAGDVPVGHRQRRGGLGGVGGITTCSSKNGGNGGGGDGTVAPAHAAATIRPPLPPRRRTLLSRSEASVLLRVSQLAIEHDALVELASTALQNANMCASFRERIEQQSCTGDNSGGASPQQQQKQQPPLQYPTRYLLPLIPILSVHADTVQRRTIEHVSRECHRILTELTRCCGSLRQFADQNWTVSEHLYMDGRGGVGGVGRNKGSFAEIEEAICDRIDGLVGMAAVPCSGAAGSNGNGPTSTSAAEGGVHDEDMKDANNGNDNNKKITKKRKRGMDELGSPQDVFDASIDFTTGQFVSMAELCRRLFTDLGEQVEESVGSADTAAHSQDAGVHKPSVDEAPASSSEASSTKQTSADDGGSSEKGEGENVDMKEARGSASGDNDGGGAEGEPPSGTMSTGPSAGNIDSASSGSTSSDENGTDDEEPNDKLVEMDEDCKDDDEPRDSSASSSPPERGQLTQSAAATLAVLASGSQTY